jgi:thiol-disulfide isomerase/thioredoxin
MGSSARRSRLAAILALALAASAVAPAAHGAPSELKGSKAPPISDNTLSGAPFSLAKYAGKGPVIVTFWSIYCKSCVEEMASLQRLYDKYGPDNLAVVAVNEDSDIGLTRVRAFLDRFAASADGRKLTLPIVFDAKGEIFERYRVLHLPTLVYVDRDGTVLEVIEGFDQGRELAVVQAIEKLITTVSVAPLREVSSEVVYDLDVKVPVCGQYRDGKWYRPLDLDEGRDDALARARSRGEDFIRRESVRLALRQLGVTLHSLDRTPRCAVGYGTELRTPQPEKDALDLILARLNLPRVVETAIPGEDRDEERQVTLYRRMRVSLDTLRDQLEQDPAFSLRKSVLRMRFVRATEAEERMFLDSLHTTFPYLSELSEVRQERVGRPEYILTSHAIPEKVAEALSALPLGARKSSAELIPGGVLEVSVWK